MLLRTRTKCVMMKFHVIKEADGAKQLKVISTYTCLSSFASSCEIFSCFCSWIWSLSGPSLPPTGEPGCTTPPSNPVAARERPMVRPPPPGSMGSSKLVTLTFARGQAQSEPNPAHYLCPSPALDSISDLWKQRQKLNLQYQTPKSFSSNSCTLIIPGIIWLWAWESLDSTPTCNNTGLALPLVLEGVKNQAQKTPVNYCHGFPQKAKQGENDRPSYSSK